MFPILKNSNRVVLGVRLARNYAVSTKQNTQDKTHFGFEEVSPKEKSERVYEVFHNVAKTYDLMNDCMSMGMHRIWKDIFVSELGPTPGLRLLDMAGGTGDIAFRVAARLAASHPPPETSKITVCDINENMLQVGKERAEREGVKGVEWVVGDAEELPQFGAGEFDAYSIAFGIRNVVDIPRALAEAHRILRPGGRFLCLEFSKVENNLLSFLYDQYSFQVIPAMGEVVAGDWRSYQYLVESIRRFPAQAAFARLLQQAGFRLVTFTNLSFGVVAIHSAFKI